MKFTIAIPAYNGGQFLRQAIESALTQTRPADEILLIDDGSTDGTAAIATSSEWSGRVRYRFNPSPTGFVDAWNRIVAQSAGDFVVILHQDDVLYPEYLARIEQALAQSDGVHHAFTACDYIDAQGDVTRRAPEPCTLEPVRYSGRDYARHYLEGMLANRHVHRCPGVATRRSLILDSCPYRKAAGHIADDDFFLRVGQFTDVIGISAPLAAFRHHPGSATGRSRDLTLRLAEDLLALTGYHRGHATLLAPEDVRKLALRTIRMVNLLLFQSLQDQRQEWLDAAHRLRRELEGAYPGIMQEGLAPWARLLWRLAPEDLNRARIARMYVNDIHRLIKLRDRLRSLIR